MSAQSHLTLEIGHTWRSRAIVRAAALIHVFITPLSAEPAARLVVRNMRRSVRRATSHTGDPL